MVLIIAGNYKFEEHLSVAASLKCFLISLVKVFSFSKLLQQQSQKSLNTMSFLNKFQQNIYLVISCFTDMLFISFAHFDFTQRQI